MATQKRNKRGWHQPAPQPKPTSLMKRLAALSQDSSERTVSSRASNADSTKNMVRSSGR